MRNTKLKIMTVVLSFVMVLTLLPTIKTNADAVSGTCGANLTWVLSDGTLTVSGTGAMTNYVRDSHNVSNAPWSAERANIKKIVVGNGVTSIGKYAFERCYEATSVVLPNTLKTIGQYSFYGCSKLTSVVIPKSVVTVGAYAFEYCKSLASVTGGAGVQVIGSYAFYDCKKLKTVKITSKSLKQIGSFAFGYTAVKTLYIQNTTKLTKKGIKKCLAESSVKTVKVKKSKVSAYKKIFTKGIVKKKVTVKK